MCVCVCFVGGWGIFFFLQLCVRNSSEGSDPGILCRMLGLCMGGWLGERGEERVCGGGCSRIIHRYGK